MPKHLVQQGECISSITDQYGFKWETVWNHPDNASLRQKRNDPNVLFAGDELFIPDSEIKEVPKPTEKRHKFVKKGAPAKLKIRLLDDYHPRAGVKYELEIDGVLKSGVTDGSGFVQSPIPAGARRGRLLVGQGTTKDIYELRLGELDPLDTDEGVSGRLLDLGFGTENLSEAISAFQRKEGLEVTGEANQSTRSQLKERFGQ